MSSLYDLEPSGAGSQLINHLTTSSIFEKKEENRKSGSKKRNLYPSLTQAINPINNNLITYLECPGMFQWGRLFLLAYPENMACKFDTGVEE
jgi:hypothetical protein